MHENYKEYEKNNVSYIENSFNSYDYESESDILFENRYNIFYLKRAYSNQFCLWVF
jgi:hypothetical protein